MSITCRRVKNKWGNSEAYSEAYSVEREGTLIKSKLNIKPAASFRCHYFVEKSEPLILCVICEYFFPLFLSIFLGKN